MSKRVKVQGVELVDAMAADRYMGRCHLSPETDPVARAICEALGIDWKKLKVKRKGWEDEPR